MPSLTETQAPLVVKDIAAGLLPPQFPNESHDAYLARLASLYNLPKSDLETLISS